MLSSLSSFLPSALQNINSTPHINPPPEVDDDDDDEERNGNGKVDSGPVTTKKREKKEKGVNEVRFYNQSLYPDSNVFFQRPSYSYDLPQQSPTIL